jgi:hypothetical protein
MVEINEDTVYVKCDSFDECHGFAESVCAIKASGNCGAITKNNLYYNAITGPAGSVITECVVVCKKVRITLVDNNIGSCEDIW